MTRLSSFLVALTVAAIAATATPRSARAQTQATHAADVRVPYIKAALEAIRATPFDALRQADNYARVLARGACSSSVARLKVECLMTASRRWCHGKGAAEAPRCQADMDVIVSNLLGDTQLISLEKRYQIMNHYKDYRRELAHETRRIQGALAVELRLRMGDAADDARLAANIDHYCLATADETNIAWQTCVSSLVWFIGTEDAFAAAHAAHATGSGE
jgi:hypothetical protein